MDSRTADAAPFAVNEWDTEEIPLLLSGKGLDVSALLALPVVIALAGGGMGSAGELADNSSRHAAGFKLRRTAAMTQLVRLAMEASCLSDSGLCHDNLRGQMLS